MQLLLIRNKRPTLNQTRIRLFKLKPIPFARYIYTKGSRTDISDIDLVTFSLYKANMLAHLYIDCNRGIKKNCHPGSSKIAQ